MRDGVTAGGNGGRAAEDVAYALGSLQICQYAPVGNLRKAGE